MVSIPKMNMKQYAAAAILYLGLTLLASTASGVEVEPQVFKTLEVRGTVNIFLSFKASDMAGVRNQIQTRAFANGNERREALFQALTTHAEETQGSVMAALGSRVQAQNVKQFWISNKLYIREAEPRLVDFLLGLEELSRIEEEKYAEIGKSVSKYENYTAEAIMAGGEQWGVSAIGAPAVWKLGFRGAGVVVGHIDTGARGTHEALRDSFRKQYGWYDPVSGTSEPTDDNGHGTHTLGTIVGRTNGIGVAPEAQWISCKACDQDLICLDSELTACAQWILCPDTPTCALAPQLVSNSWGSTPEHGRYEDLVDNWVEAGIIPIFSVGNAGFQGCSSVGSPGTHQQVIGVGATTPLNQVADTSGRGPSQLIYQRIQPDLAAPGTVVTSSAHTSDGGYMTMDGTSMACPHVSGVIALLLSKDPTLKPGRVRTLLLEGTKAVDSKGEVCGNVRDSEYPNNHVGHGLVNALNSVKIMDGEAPDPAPNPPISLPITTETPQESTTDGSSIALPSPFLTTLFSAFILKRLAM